MGFRFRRLRLGLGEQIRLQRIDRGALLEFPQLLSGGANDRAGYARQCGHLDTVALIGRAFLDGVQEDDTVVMLDGIEMHVGQFRVFVGQAR